MRSLLSIAFLSAPMLWAQPSGYGISPQHGGWIGLPAGGSTMTSHSLRPDGQTGPVLGRPFSAAEVRHTRQTLADGTHLDQTDTSAFYRDAQGRMRSESQRRIVIFDPVSHHTYVLDPAGKTFQTFAAGSETASTSIAVIGDSTWVNSASGSAPHGPVETRSPHEFRQFHSEPAAPPVTEDLGTETVNGIVSKGSRITITIPTGVMGNDHEIKVVNERWYSDALQVLVRTVNNDPRFGVTTYDLTNFVPLPPDPKLFQLPPDYRLQNHSFPH